MANEEIYIEKRILCPKCGHVHEFSLKASLSVNNFVVDGYCIACGAAITVDKNTIFKNTHVNVGVPVVASPAGLESVETSESGASQGDVPEDVLSFFDETAGSSKSSSADIMTDMFEQ